MIIKPDPRRPMPDQDIDAIALQLDRFERAALAHKRWAESAKVCQDFVEGRQWTDAEKKKLADEGRPPVTLNRIRPRIRLVSGTFKQNRYDLRYLPAATGGATDETANSLTHTAKQVDEANQIRWVDGEVFRDGLVTGRGYYDIRISTQRNLGGEIKVSVADPFSVYIDPEAQEYDPASWGFVSISHWLSFRDIEVTFGAAVANQTDMMGSRTPFPTGRSVYGGDAGVEVAPTRWFGLYDYLESDNERFLWSGAMANGLVSDHIDRTRKLIRVVETQHRVMMPVRKFVDVATLETKAIPDHWGRDKIVRVMEWAASYNQPVDVITAMEPKIRHTFTAADVILYDEWAPYDSFTIVPYFAYFRRGVTQGMIDDLLDPQREVNKRRSVFLHILMTTANSGWSIEEESLDDINKRLLEEEGSRPGLVVTHKKGKPKPERITPVVAPTSLDKAELKAIDDIEAISGINASTMGEIDRVQSGRALALRQRQAIVGAEDYFDNFARTRELRGRKYLELIQGWYTEERIIRTRGEDGKNADQVLNQRSAAGKIVNDVTLGSYTVAIDEAPMAATFANMEFDDLVTLAKDLGVPIDPDILIDASSVSRKRELIKRVRMRMGVDENGEPLVPPGTDPALGGAPGGETAPVQPAAPPSPTAQLLKPPAPQAA